MVNIIKPNLAFNGSLSPINKSRVDKFVQHHMAHPTWNINDVHNFHKNSNGWAGIGYNYWIGFDGKIYQGRGMNVGAHAGGHNSHTIGVGYQGDFTKQNMTDAQLQSGIALNKWLMSQFPNVNSTSQIIGHNDLASTACPGKHFRMTELRKGVGGGSYTPPKTQTKPSNSNKVSWKKLTGNWTGQTLKQDQYGTPVKQLQEKLASKYFYPNKGAKNNGIDSYYGADTADAVRRFQSVNGLTADGIAGKKTYEKLNGKTTTNTASKSTSKSLPSAVYHAIKPYPKSANVKKVQQALASVYFYPNKGAKNNGVDSVYGPDTADAVKRFQSVNGLTADGVYGPATRKKLLSVMK